MSSVVAADTWPSIAESVFIHAVFQRQRREGMAQIMKSNMLAFCVLQNELQSAAHHAGRNGAVLFHRGREHPAGVHRLFVLPQHCHHRRRQDDLADGVLRLGRADLELTAHIVDLLVHIQHTGFEVQVIPLQRHQLAPTQAGGQVQKEDLVVALKLRLNEESLQLFSCQHLHLPRFLGRQLAAEGRVHTDQPILHRLLQCGAAGGVTHTHHSVGQPFAVLVGEPLPAAFLESTVELLQVVLCQLIQRNVPNLRDDVQADAALIGLLRSWADLRLGVILVPVCQPVPEGHLRPHLLRLQPAAFLLELLELLNAFLLRFSENIFRLGITVVIVADDDAPLPPTVLALSYGSVAGFSLSCHGFNSFPKISSMKPPTMPQAVFCISVVTWV